MLLIVVLMVAMDLGYTSIYNNCKPRNKLQYILNLKNEKFDVVFIGSSRVANHIDSELFDKLSNQKTINFGVEGANLNDNLLQLELLLKNNTSRFVFLQIDSNLETTNPSNISTAEAMPFIHNEIINNHSKRYLTNYFAISYIPFYRYATNDAKIGCRELFFSLVNKKPGVDPSKGFTPKEGNSIPSDPKKVMGQGIVLKDNAILDQIRIVCKTHQTQLVLFMTPLCSKMDSKPYVNKIKKLEPNLIDLTQGFADSLFYNCGHLNRKGAEILTERLYNSTKKEL